MLTLLIVGTILLILGDNGIDYFENYKAKIGLYCSAIMSAMGLVILFITFMTFIFRKISLFLN